jgi:hypothetical protein
VNITADAPQIETILLERVVIRQDDDSHFAIEDLQSPTDKELERLQDYGAGPRYLLEAKPIFGADMTVEFHVKRCNAEFCQTQTFDANIEFEEKPKEFEFWLLNAFISV